MSDDQTPPQRPGEPRSEDVASLVRDIQEDAEQKQKVRKHPSKRGKPKTFWYILLALALAGNAYVWIGQPAWLVGERAARTPQEREEGVLRFRMYVQAQRIEAFRQEHQRLPETLAEVGSSFPGLTYRRTSETTWELLGENGRARLVLLSTQPMEEFLGNYQEAVGLEDR